jgi:hypothetical protein
LKAPSLWRWINLFSGTLWIRFQSHPQKFQKMISSKPLIRNKCFQWNHRIFKWIWGYRFRLVWDCVSIKNIKLEMIKIIIFINDLELFSLCWRIKLRNFWWRNSCLFFSRGVLIVGKIRYGNVLKIGNRIKWLMRFRRIYD